MPYIVHCPRPSCTRRLAVEETTLGMPIRCPHCDQVFRAARPEPAPATTPAQTRADEVMIPTAVVTITPAVPPPMPVEPGATLSFGPAASNPAQTLGDPDTAVSPTPSPAATLDAITHQPIVPDTGHAPSAPPSTDDATLPSRIGRFDIRQRLGEGAFGVVYRAYDSQLDREVALKVAKPNALNTEQRVKRFLREAKAAASLRHPHIVPVHDSGRDGDHYYIASAFIPGRSLAAALEEQPRGLEPRTAAQIVRKVAEALAYAHSRGVIHRDVKPANIMLDELGEPLLMDFGLAARSEGEEKLTQEAAAMGTPAYMAPEQAAGQAEAASDQYSLGCTLYELLTGQTPFSGPPELQIFLHQTQEPASPRKVNPRLPRDLETICLKCVQKKPDQRYASAQALADDLGRFLAGDAIRARPEGTVRWLGRKLRRHWLPATAAALLLAGLTTAGVIVWQQRQVQEQADARLRQATELEDGIETALKLETSAWTPAHAAAVEQQIAALEPLAPESAARFRQRLTKQLHQSLVELLARPRLDAAEIKRFEENLQALAARAPQGVAELRRGLQQRLRTWETVFSLQPPFANRTNVVPTRTRVQGDELLPVRTGAAYANPLVPTAFPSTGNTQLEAVFSASWTSAPSVGVLLNARNERYYAILVSRAPDPDGPLKRPAANRNRCIVTIMRGKMSLSTREVVIAPGPLTIRASRDGDLLSVQVNGSPPQSFQDAFPLSADEGFFGLYWPAGVGLSRVTALRQALPPTLSPLEQADQRYAQHQYVDALAMYRQQAVAAGKGPFAQEARVKVGLCLLELNQTAEAQKRFEEVAREPGDRWPLVAACRLWLLHLKQHRLEEAEAVFLSISGNHRFEELLAVLPDETRAEILGFYALTEHHFFFQAPDLLTRAERADRVCEFLQDSPGVRVGVKHQLMRAYVVCNQPDRAVQVARETLERFRRLPTNEQLWASRLITDYCWILRLRGEGRKARAELDSWIYQSPGVYRIYEAHESDVVQLLLERVRVDVALNDWEQAERDLAECHRMVRTNVGWNYYAYSTTYLFQGFLSERKGDKEGARAAWQKATVKAWRQESPDRELLEGPALARIGLWDLQNLFAAGMSGELTDGDVEQFLSRVLTSLAGNAETLPPAFVSQVRLSPDAMRKMLDAPRGRRVAYQVAFRTVSLGDVIRAPAFLLAAEMLRQGAFVGEPTEEQEAVIMSVVQQCHANYCAGKIGKTQLLQIALTWKGTTNFLGWEALAPTLAPAMRGPSAYVMGHRLLRLNKPQEADRLFRTALADAPAGSSLKRLAEEAIKSVGN